jgi:NADPH:quinone reductase-like Zn-dependent oxidoreductase
VKFAKAAGATVIATTSSDAKAETLKKLGADHIINYKADPNWGETAKGLTSGKEGVDNVMEVGGPKTLAQSLKAVKLEGLVTIIGYLQGQVSNLPAELERGMKRCILRGIMVGSRQQFEQMNKAIETNDIHPIIDKTAFSLEQLKEAFQYQVSS